MTPKTTKKRPPGKRAIEDPRRRLTLAEAVAPMAAVRPSAPLDRLALIAFRSADLAEPVGARTTMGLPPASVVRRDLTRYYAILGDATDRLRAFGDLTDDVLTALRTACAGVAFESAQQVRTLWAFGVIAFGETHPVTKMLRAAPLATLLAVVDLLESGMTEAAATEPPPVVAEPDATEGDAHG